jgi:hypothetical protein
MENVSARLKANGIFLKEGAVAVLSTRLERSNSAKHVNGKSRNEPVASDWTWGEKHIERHDNELTAALGNDYMYSLPQMLKNKNLYAIAAYPVYQNGKITKWTYLLRIDKPADGRKEPTYVSLIASEGRTGGRILTAFVAGDREDNKNQVEDMQRKSIFYILDNVEGIPKSAAYEKYKADSKAYFRCELKIESDDTTGNATENLRTGLIASGIPGRYWKRAVEALAVYNLDQSRDGVLNLSDGAWVQERLKEWWEEENRFDNIYVLDSFISKYEQDIGPVSKTYRKALKDAAYKIFEQYDTKEGSRLAELFIGRAFFYSKSYTEGRLDTAATCYLDVLKEHPYLSGQFVDFIGGMPGDYTLQNIKEAAEIAKTLPDKAGVPSHLQPSTLFLSKLREHSDMFPKDVLSAIREAFIQLHRENPQKAYGLIELINSDLEAFSKKYGKLCPGSAATKEAVIAAYLAMSENMKGTGSRSKTLPLNNFNAFRGSIASIEGSDGITGSLGACVSDLVSHPDLARLANLIYLDLSVVDVIPTDVAGKGVARYNGREYVFGLNEIVKVVGERTKKRADFTRVLIRSGTPFIAAYFAVADHERRHFSDGRKIGSKKALERRAVASEVPSLIALKAFAGVVARYDDALAKGLDAYGKDALAACNELYGTSFEWDSWGAEFELNLGNFIENMGSKGLSIEEIKAVAGEYSVFLIMLKERIGSLEGLSHEERQRALRMMLTECREIGILYSQVEGLIDYDVFRLIGKEVGWDVILENPGDFSNIIRYMGYIGIGNSFKIFEKLGWGVIRERWTEGKLEEDLTNISNLGSDGRAAGLFLDRIEQIGSIYGFYSLRNMSYVAVLSDEEVDKLVSKRMSKPILKVARRYNFQITDIRYVMWILENRNNMYLLNSLAKGDIVLSEDVVHGALPLLFLCLEESEVDGIPIWGRYRWSKPLHKIDYMTYGRPGDRNVFNPYMGWEYVTALRGIRWDRIDRKIRGTIRALRKTDRAQNRTWYEQEGPVYEEALLQAEQKIDYIKREIESLPEASGRLNEVFQAFRGIDNKEDKKQIKESRTSIGAGSYVLRRKFDASLGYNERIKAPSELYLNVYQKLDAGLKAVSWGGSVAGHGVDSIYEGLHRRRANLSYLRDHARELSKDEKESIEEKVKKEEQNITQCIQMLGSALNPAGLYLEQPPLHQGNRGEDARLWEPHSGALKDRTYYKITTDGTEIYVNAKEYRIVSDLQGKPDELKIILCSYSREPKPDKLGERGLSLQIVRKQGKNETTWFLTREQTEELVRKLEKETLITLYYNNDPLLNSAPAQ